MLDTRYESKIMSSDQLNGQTGDNGEDYVVFNRDIINPLNSSWAWFASLRAAQEYKDTL